MSRALGLSNSSLACTGFLVWPGGRRHYAARHAHEALSHKPTRLGGQQAMLAGCGRGYTVPLLSNSHREC